MTTPRIDELVRRTGRSLLIADVSELLLRALFVVTLAVAAAVAIDAGYALPVSGVVVIDVLLLTVAGLIVWPVMDRLRRGRLRDRQTAVHIEQHLQVPDNRLINALDIAGQDAACMSVPLRNEVLARGEAAAQTIDSRTVIDWDALKSAAKPTVAAVLGLVLAYALLPSVFHAVVPRLVAPFADLPPFTLVKFDVRTDPETIFHGKPGAIRVALSGPGIHEQAQVVFEDADGKVAPLPMYRVTSGRPDRDGEVAAQHFALRIDRVEGSRRFYVLTPNGRSDWHVLTADTSPLFEQAEVAYEYPAYTGWRSTTGPLSSAGIRALSGTHVTLRIESNVPLGGGEIKLSPEGENNRSTNPTVRLTPDGTDPRAAQLTFPLEHNGRFELAIIGADGKPGVQTLTGRLTALPDRSPKIDIVDPERQVVAPEGWQIESHISAGDDIGLGPITLHRGLNDNPTTPTPLPHDYVDVNKTVSRAAHTFDLARIGAKTGDVVRYYAAVQDNRPGSPQSAETPVYTIHVISMQQYMELARSRYLIDDINSEFEAIMERLGALETQRNELLEKLAEFKAHLAAGQPLTEEQQQALAEMEAALNAYAEEATALADTLRERSEQFPLYEFEDAYKGMLSTLSEQLRSQTDRAATLAEAMRALRESQPGERSAQASAAMRGQADAFELQRDPFAGEASEQTQMTQEDLERLQLAEAMIAQGERIRRVAFEQDELAVRTASLAAPRTLSEQERRRAEALAQEQAQLREELEGAATALREAAEKASGLLPNMSSGAVSVADKIDDLAIVATQTVAQKALLAGNGPVAHQAALEAADKLDSLLSDVSQSQSLAEGDLDGCFNLPRNGVQNALSQMAAARRVPGMGMAGASGAGMSGQFAQMSVVGPDVPGRPQGDSVSRSGRRDARGGRGRSTSHDADLDVAAEVIHADTTDAAAGGAFNLPGVPIEYREQAQAYFRRIAEEER